MSTLPVMTKKNKNSRSLDDEFHLMPVFSIIPIRWWNIARMPGKPFKN